MALSSSPPSSPPPSTRPSSAGSGSVGSPVEPTFLSHLLPGAASPARPALLRPYGPDERRAGDELLARLDPLLAGVDAAELDRTAKLPDGLVDGLRSAGFLALRNPEHLGGPAASDYNAFRAVEHAAHTSVAVGQLLAVQNGVGAPALLAGLPPGPLAEFVARHVAAGTLSGFGGTEPDGQNNTWPTTTAARAADGSYVLDGEKVFTGNAPVAGLVAVTATVPEGARRRAAVVFVETASPGVEVSARHEFLGSRGLPNGSLRFAGVRVPGERVVLGDEPDDPRFPAGIGRVAMVGQLVFNGAPALAVVRRSLRFQREFVARRTIDGRPLAGYDAIRRLAAQTLAEAYAADSVVRWCLGGGERAFDLLLAKNICTLTAWRTADRTVSVLGGEGLETASSKLRRGARPLPLEQLLRDARGLRVSGNIDFLLDIRAGRLLLAQYAGERPATPPAASEDEPDFGGLSDANRRHFVALRRDLRRLGEWCARLATASPGEDQEAARLVGRAAGELLAVFATLARAAAEDSGFAARQELADVHCAAARHRLDGLWRRLAAYASDPGIPHRSVSRTWFATSDLDFLVSA
ncbi:acyl-CoA dehydrogenase family protein [Streptomyces sp. NPDC001663]|uniref:acyl-CoA dehydrogenase family protein n=1 Tax=Streptomyces sp. NPDC001663 TaxID=3364597 RepID=UPI003673CACF